MCEEQGNRMGKACILIKSGRNMEGVTIISEIFLEGVKEYLPVLRKQGEVEQGRRERILAQLGVVLLTCHKEWLVDNDRGVPVSSLRKTSGRRTPRPCSANWQSTTSTPPTCPKSSASSSTR